jgi:hypothetical protein
MRWRRSLIAQSRLVSWRQSRPSASHCRPSRAAVWVPRHHALREVPALRPCNTWAAGWVPRSVTGSGVVWIPSSRFLSRGYRVAGPLPVWVNARCVLLRIRSFPQQDGQARTLAGSCPSSCKHMSRPALVFKRPPLEAPVSSSGSRGYGSPLLRSTIRRVGLSRLRR